MISQAKRLIMITSAISLVAACASPTAPSRITQPTAARLDGDSLLCRSGYNTANGRCNDEE